MHTPKPWVIGKTRANDNQIEIVWESGTKFYNKKTVVCSVSPLSHYTQGNQEANAKHIVKCVNSHDALIEACKGAMGAIQRILDKHDPDSTEYELVGVLNDALKQAESEV